MDFLSKSECVWDMQVGIPIIKKGVKRWHYTSGQVVMDTFLKTITTVPSVCFYTDIVYKDRKTDTWMFKRTRWDRNELCILFKKHLLGDNDYKYSTMEILESENICSCTQSIFESVYSKDYEAVTSFCTMRFTLADDLWMDVCRTSCVEKYYIVFTCSSKNMRNLLLQSKFTETLSRGDFFSLEDKVLKHKSMVSILPEIIFTSWKFVIDSYGTQQNLNEWKMISTQVHRFFPSNKKPFFLSTKETDDTSIKDETVLRFSFCDNSDEE